MRRNLFAKNLVALASLFFLASCGGSSVSSSGSVYNQDGELLYIAPPEENDLAFWLGDELNDEVSSEHTFIPGWFGAEEYLDGRYETAYSEGGYPILPEVGVTYVFSGYPDALDTWKVTRITITDPEISFYGLNLLSEQEEIGEKMEAIGFSQKEGATQKYYVRGRISFAFSDEEIVISAVSTNNHGIVY